MPPALTLGIAPGALGHRRVEVGALQPDAARAREPIEDEVAAAPGEKAGLEPIDLLGHLHRVVAVHPAAGLDVDRLPRLEVLLEHIAVAVHPHHPLVVAGVELIDEEAAAVEHVGEALDPAVVVLDVAGGRQELVLAHDDPVARRQMQGGDMAGSVAAEGDLPGRLGLDQQQRHTAERAALEALLERVQTDLHLRVLPQQHVMLEVDRHLAVQRHVQDRHQLALESIVQSGRRPLRDRRRQHRRCARHQLSSFRWAPGTPSRLASGTAEVSR